MKKYGPKIVVRIGKKCKCRCRKLERYVASQKRQKEAERKVRSAEAAEEHGGVVGLQVGGGSVEMSVVGGSGISEQKRAESKMNGGSGSERQKGEGKTTHDRNERLSRLSRNSPTGGGKHAEVGVLEEQRNPMHKKRSSMELMAPDLDSSWHTGETKGSSRNTIVPADADRSRAGSMDL